MFTVQNQRMIKNGLIISLCILSNTLLSQVFKNTDYNTLANGARFQTWEKKQSYLRTYYVDKENPASTDNNPGTEARPFSTISHAAAILKPGERVIIKSGIYRECVRPKRGGTSADSMITYEAAPGSRVVIRGSIPLDAKRWTNAAYFNYQQNRQKTDKPIKIWQYDFDGTEFAGYNPFLALNLMLDRSWLQYKKEVNMNPHFKRRGMIFLNGEPLRQVLLSTELADNDSGAFWVEHNGMSIHVRFPHNTSPSDYTIEATNQEQVFVPSEYSVNYIVLRGITFEHGGNGFPVPQRGIVSSRRGHHWIIENCTIQYANSVGIDLGNEIWSAYPVKGLGYDIIRGCVIRQCGISGLQGMWCKNMLIEDNLFENIGWQDAELAFESGGIKLHGSANTLIRRNVFRNITTAPGIWLDYQSNKNCRITKNIFASIITARGAIYVEASHSHCRIDHNFFYGLQSRYWLTGDYGAGGNALYTDGSDSIDFDHNMMTDIENSGYGAYLNAERLVDSRGGITRWHRVTDNIFTGCRKYCIEFANEYNFSDRNLFYQPLPGYIRIGTPPPALMLDAPTCSKLFGWEKNNRPLDDEYILTVNFNPQTLILSIASNSNSIVPEGPFLNLHSLNEKLIDPREPVKP